MTLHRELCLALKRTYRKDQLFRPRILIDPEPKNTNQNGYPFEDVHSQCRVIIRNKASMGAAAVFTDFNLEKKAVWEQLLFSRHGPENSSHTQVIYATQPEG